MTSAEVAYRVVRLNANASYIVRGYLLNIFQEADDKEWEKICNVALWEDNCKMYEMILTLVLLNKLRCHTHF